jgi:hypothetical protein
MKLLIAFLIGAFLAGGLSQGRLIRSHPIVLLAISTCVAAAFYSLRVAR